MKTRNLLLLLVSALLFLTLAFFSLLTRNPVKGSLTIEAGTSLSVTDFYNDAIIFKLLEDAEMKMINVQDLTGVETFPTDTPGEFPIQFLVNGKTRTVRLTVVDTVKPEGDVHDAVINSNQKCQKRDLVSEVRDATAVKITISGASKYNNNPAPGVYPVKVMLTDAGGNKKVYSKKIVAIPFKKVHVELGGAAVAPENFIKGKPDFIESVSFDSSFLIADFANTPGKYDASLVIKCKEKNGDFKINTKAPFTVSDTTPPEIIGAEDIVIYKGQTPEYRKNVFVKDKQEEPVRLNVKADTANKDKPGTYPVTYSAKDNAGNKTKVKVKLVVLPASKNHTKALAKQVDKVLADIIKPEMSDIDKLAAIWHFCHDTFTYTGESEKGNPVNAAYQAFKTKRGDCYSYYAAADALITKAGFECMMVERKSQKSHHFWNLVKYKGEWYHFDSCPLIKGETFVPFMLSDSDLLAFSESYSKRHPDAAHKDYYLFDSDRYPERARNSINIK